MIVLRLALQSLLNRWVTALLTVLAIAVSIVAAAGRREGAHRRAPELRRHHLRHRPDRRRPQRQPQPAALFGVPHRQRHQQHHLAELPGHRRRGRRSPGSCRCRWATATAASACSAPRPTTSRTTSIAADARPRRFAAGKPFADLFDAVIGADVAAALGYKVGDPIVVVARARLGLVRRARRQAVPRLRHPRRRPARRSTARCTSAWRRSRPSTSTGRAARAFPDSRVSADEVRRMDLEAEGDHGRPDRPQVEARDLPPAAGHQRVPRRAAVGDPAGGRAAGAVGAGRHGRDGADRRCPPWWWRPRCSAWSP